eukprot:g15583.t1
MGEVVAETLPSAKGLLLSSLGDQGGSTAVAQLPDNIKEVDLTQWSHFLTPVVVSQARLLRAFSSSGGSLNLFPEEGDLTSAALTAARRGQRYTKFCERMLDREIPEEVLAKPRLSRGLQEDAKTFVNTIAHLVGTSFMPQELHGLKTQKLLAHMFANAVTLSADPESPFQRKTPRRPVKEDLLSQLLAESLRKGDYVTAQWFARKDGTPDPETPYPWLYHAFTATGEWAPVLSPGKVSPPRRIGRFGPVESVALPRGLERLPEFNLAAAEEAGRLEGFAGFLDMEAYYVGKAAKAFRATFEQRWRDFLAQTGKVVATQATDGDDGLPAGAAEVQFYDFVYSTGWEKHALFAAVSRHPEHRVVRSATVNLGNGREASEAEALAVASAARFRLCVFNTGDGYNQAHRHRTAESGRQQLRPFLCWSNLRAADLHFPPQEKENEYEKGRSERAEVQVAAFDKVGAVESNLLNWMQHLASKKCSPMALALEKSTYTCAEKFYLHAHKWLGGRKATETLESADPMPRQQKDTFAPIVSVGNDEFSEPDFFITPQRKGSCTWSSMKAYSRFFLEDRFSRRVSFSPISFDGGGTKMTKNQGKRIYKQLVGELQQCATRLLTKKVVSHAVASVSGAASADDVPAQVSLGSWAMFRSLATTSVKGLAFAYVGDGGASIGKEEVDKETRTVAQNLISLSHSDSHWSRVDVWLYEQTAEAMLRRSKLLFQ